jgi:hypothetical protein
MWVSRIEPGSVALCQVLPGSAGLCCSGPEKKAEDYIGQATAG